MKLLVVADEECMSLWDYYVPPKLKSYDLILSAGDLHAAYLSFLVTMARCPLYYIHGNHDTGYAVTEPEGCDSIDGAIIEYRGLRILGLGGCRKYRPGPHQYTDEQMKKRIRKLKWEIAKYGGVDIVLAHTPPRGVGDAEDLPHMGFDAFLPLLERYKPRYLFHGHIHLRYGRDLVRERQYLETRVINACEKYELEIPDAEIGNWKKLNLIERIRFYLTN